MSSYSDVVFLFFFKVISVFGVQGERVRLCS